MSSTLCKRMEDSFNVSPLNVSLTQNELFCFTNGTTFSNNATTRSLSPFRTQLVS